MSGMKLILAAVLVLAAMSWLLTPARSGTAAPLGEGAAILADSASVGDGRDETSAASAEAAITRADPEADEEDWNVVAEMSAEERAEIDALMRESWEPIHSHAAAMDLTMARLRPELTVDEAVVKRIRYRDLEAWLQVSGDSGYGQDDPVYLVAILAADMRSADMLMSSGIPSIAGEAETPSEYNLRPIDGLFMAWHAESGDQISGGSLVNPADPTVHLSLAGLRLIEEIPNAAMPEYRSDPSPDARDAEALR